MRKNRKAYRAGFYWGNLKETDRSRDIGIDGIKSKQTLRKLDGWALIGLIWLRIGTSARLL